SGRSLAILERYSWPGNVRQLENLLERCLVLCDDAEIDLETTPFGAELGALLAPGKADGAATLEEIQRRHIESTLRRLHGNRADAAKELGVSVRSLYYRMKSLKLTR